MLGQRLIKLRKERKWTQQDIAKKINISRSAYAGYETDRRVPEYATLVKLADTFECSFDYLAGRENKNKTFEEHLEAIEKFDPFLIFELIKTKTDEEIINEYRHQAEGKDIDEDTVRAHLKFVRYLESQKK